MIGLADGEGGDPSLGIVLNQALEEVEGFEKFRWQMLVTLHVGGVKKNHTRCVASVWRHGVAE